MTKLTVTGDFSGAYSVCMILERNVSPALMAQMKRSGQQDCGMRQSLVPLQCESYPEFIDAFSRDSAKLDYALPSFGPIEVSGDPRAREQAFEVALKLAEFETKRGRPTEVTEINRAIPCV